MFFNSIIFTSLILFFYIGLGYFAEKIFNIRKVSFFDSFIYGSILAIFISLFLNLITPLNIYVTNLLFFFFLLIGLFRLFTHTINYKVLISFIFVILYSAIITLYSMPNDDYQLYHLP